MNPYWEDRDVTLYQGDSLAVLRGLPDASVDCVVTSPPYWGLRDYGTGTWEGGDEACDHSVGGQVPDTKAPGAITTGQRPGVDASTCRKCGARRVDQQVGLEGTPDEYVAAIVSIFREVRRVLAPHGTCWINLGDSYAGSWSGNSMRPDGGEQRPGGPGFQPLDARVPARSGNTPEGLKPKDLVGIPWRVARALQEPYYTGDIKDERERIWLAAMVEAEGCLYIHKRKAGQPNGQGYERKNDSYSSGMEVASTDRVIVERCLEITGKGSICEQTPEQATRRKQTIYRWTLRSNECRAVVTELYPHFVAKHHEARILIGCPSSGADAEKAHASLKALHQGDAPSIDFPAPKTLYEPGWYLRADVIWSKPNPMPESVTDRPTKSHEYVFLLTQKARYFFDQEGVREPHKAAGDGEHDGRGRNIRSVWSIATQPYKGAHFATYPEELVRRCVLAGCPERVCQTCGKPSERIVEASGGTIGKSWHEHDTDLAVGQRSGSRDHKRASADGYERDYRRDTVGWSDCGHNNWRPGVVLDPFAGSGTTCKVASENGRDSIGIDLSDEYLDLAIQRLRGRSYHQPSLLT